MRFPGFTDEWKKCTIRDIAKIEKGNGISKDQLSDEGDECILYGELYTKYQSEIIDEVYSKTKVDSTKLMRSQANDVLIPCSGETAEDIATARCVKKDGILLGGDLNIIRFNKQDGAFMSYQLNGKRKFDIARVAQGVSVVHLYPEHLKSIKVCIPRIEEQQKIVILLSLIDKRIATQNKIIEDLQSLIKGLAKTLTNQGEPNTRISDCLEYHTSTLQEGTLNENGLYPVYGASGIAGFLNDYRCDKDSILIIKDGSGAGTVSYATGKYSVIGTLNYLTAKSEYSLKYLYFCLMGFNFEPFKTGMAIPHIYFRDYGQAKIYCPSIGEQEHIAKALTIIETKLNIESLLLKSLYMEKQYLLNNMFR